MGRRAVARCVRCTGPLFEEDFTSGRVKAARARGQMRTVGNVVVGNVDKPRGWRHTECPGPWRRQARIKKDAENRHRQQLAHAQKQAELRSLTRRPKKE